MPNVTDGRIQPLPCQGTNRWAIWIALRKLLFCKVGVLRLFLQGCQMTGYVKILLTHHAYDSITYPYQWHHPFGNLAIWKVAFLQS